jgi:hypothetical protein
MDDGSASIASSGKVVRELEADVASIASRP